MSSDPSEDPQAAAVEQLERFGVSALVNGRDADPSDPRSETAIWGEGESNSLVVVLKAIFTWRLDTADPD